MVSPERWIVVAECPDSVQAQVVAGLLRSETIPVRVENPALIPGLEPGAKVLVPASFVHRAQLLLVQLDASDVSDPD